MRISRTLLGGVFPLLVAACGGGAGLGSGDGGAKDVPVSGGDTASDRPYDGAAGDGGGQGGTQSLGTACTEASACASGFCVDGVCCNTACTETCRTCAAQGAIGTCMPADVGTDPRDECDDTGVASCGTDGVCDGAGACRKYASGAVCKPQGCEASTLTAASRCDGEGACVAPPGQSCTPFACGANGRCLVICANDADCVAPNSCINGSCGKKPIGAACGNTAECNSDHCEQGICCGSACTGLCRSCAVPGSTGMCTDVPDGQDPLGQCADGMAASCDTDGACDGKGACRLYAAGTVCITPSCAGATATLAGRCDGAGACTAGTQQPCDPYVCGTGGRCLTSCTADADCSGVNVCNSGVCGKRTNGVACTSGDDCQSGACHQGVCCNVACTGICVSCALTGTRGACTPIAAGQDPLNQCDDAGGASCGTDGSCNGAGVCRLYATGGLCGSQTCSGSSQRLAARCDGLGNCVPGASQTCMPYVCGATSCLTTCSTGADCSSGNVCMGGSCGKLPLGAPCGAGPDCLSGICAQGVCCQSACTANCMSCALQGTAGTCSTVPAGADPLNQCADQGAASCGTDGTCDGVGGCRLYGSGTTCLAGSCSMASSTAPRTCNGTGVCQTAMATACDPYQCGTGGTCRTTCSSDNDCVAPNICNAGVCAKKALGVACAGGGECASGLCQQGVCCGSSCTGACRSCALAGSLGSCAPVAAGADPLNQCTDNGAASCGTDGTCDGAGACRLYGVGTPCASSTCVGLAFTPARTCNGTGSCLPSTPTTCDPFICGTNGACRTTCMTSSDCNPPNTCNNGSCGQKPVGSTCTVPGECNSGLCEQGICCTTSCTGTCRSCALTGTLGTCASVPAGQDTLNQCADQGAMSCGTDGFCNGSGACRLYAVGTTCVGSMCSGTTFTPARTCNGTGTCQTVTQTNCGRFVCGTTGSCLTTCTTSAECAFPNVCVGTACVTDLLAYYSFNETTGTVAADSSGNGKNATLTGGPTFAAGMIANAVNLAGDNDFVDMPDGLLSGVRDFTAAAWVFIRTDRMWQRIFDFGNDMTVNMFLTPHAQGANVVRFAITTGGNTMEQVINGTAILPIGVWKHVVVVLGSTGGVLYVDGVQVGTNATMALRPADLGTTVNNWAGRSQYAVDPFFDGLVDELRLYRRALTAAEVTTLFNSR